MTLRVLVADDQALVRTGLRLIIESAPDLRVVGEAADGDQAVRAVAELAPDVVLMDVRMPRCDGIEATRRIVAAGGTSSVVILTTYDLDEYVFDALEAGASGFLLKQAPPEELLLGVRAAAAGDALLAPAITRRLIASFAARHPQGDGRGLELLTAREREVLQHVARGLSNAEVAQALFVEPSTVKTHLAHALAKLGLRDRVQAVIYAYENGLVATKSQPAGGGGSRPQG